MSPTSRLVLKFYTCISIYSQYNRDGILPAQLDRVLLGVERLETSNEETEAVEAFATTKLADILRGRPILNDAPPPIGLTVCHHPVRNI